MVLSVPMPGTHYGVSVLPEELMAHGSREHPLDTDPTLVQQGSGSGELGTHMKSTSWVRSAISSSAQHAAALRDEKEHSPLEHFPSEHSPCAIRATP